jgi:hypothetical protein
VKARRAAITVRFADERAYRLWIWESRIWMLAKEMADNIDEAKTLYDPFEKNSHEDLLDAFGTALDVAGMLPIVGIVPDLLNIAFCAARGHWGDAGFNLVAAIPGFGDAAKGGKMAAKAAGKLNNVPTALLVL